MAKDIHKIRFDEGTKIKLYILREYFKEWLPVFLKGRQQHWDKILIYDFFAGEGTDVDGQLGSPLILLNELKSYCKEMAQRKLFCKLILNEFDASKFKKLQNNVRSFLSECRKSQGCPKCNSEGCIFTLSIENKDFKDFFLGIYNLISKNPNLPRFMFLDQYGIKQITEDVFRKLVKLKRTDFIFFISSSYASRFAEIPEFKRYLKLSRQQFDINKPYHCHRVIFEYYKQLIPSDSEYFLAPFSIRKGSNVYGLIFGTNHTLGMEKFLNIGWRINQQTGDANFDIDNEYINLHQPKLFSEFDVPNKLQLFKKELRNKILDRIILTNKQVYNFTFEMGCLPKHANEEIRKLQKEGKILNDLPLQSQNIHRLVDAKITFL